MDIVGGMAWFLSTVGVFPPLTGGIFIASALLKEIISNQGTLGKLKEKLLAKLRKDEIQAKG